MSTHDKKIAESDKFAKPWKKLARNLGIPPPVVERIAGDEPDDINEQCSMMLSYWIDNYPPATVTRLAEAIWECQDEAMLEKAHEYFCPTQ